MDSIALCGHLIAYMKFVKQSDLFDEKACIRRLFLLHARLTVRKNNKEPPAGGSLLFCEPFSNHAEQLIDARIPPLEVQPAEQRFQRGRLRILRG